MKTTVMNNLNLTDLVDLGPLVDLGFEGPPLRSTTSKPRKNKNETHFWWTWWTFFPPYTRAYAHVRAHARGQRTLSCLKVHHSTNTSAFPVFFRGGPQRFKVHQTCQ
jgi:hypothetical protein